MTVAEPVRPISTDPAAGSGRAVLVSSNKIALRWLVWLRWFAVVGQSLAVLVAVRLVTDLAMKYDLVAIGLIIGTTLVTNIAFEIVLRVSRTVPEWMVSITIVLDISLLTALLHFTGGPDNPFVIVYTLWVMMATVLLGVLWGWITLAQTATCFLSLLALDTSEPPLDATTRQFGQLVALILVLILIAYFIGRTLAALHHRDVELVHLRERAQQSEQLAALTTLAAGAAHELGTPLGTIAVVSKEMEFAAMKQNATDLAEDARLVREQVDRCREILDHLRGDVAGRGADEPGTSEVDDVIHESLSRLRPGRSQRVDIDCPVDGSTMVAAPLRALGLAVQFMVNNAFDASDVGARVKLIVELGRGPTGATVQFIVEDTGSGMDAETTRRAMEPFFTTKEPGAGMGLGLFLVRLVADRNDGTFELRSEVGKGTQARLAIPKHTSH